MYSFSSFEPVYCSMAGSNCCFLTCIQVSQETGKVVWYTHLFKNFPQFIVMHTVKGFGVVSKAEVAFYLELSCFFYDPIDFGNLISGSSSFSKPSLDIWKFFVHIMLKPACLPGCFSSVWLFVTLWTIAQQFPLFMGFSRQEYWSRLPFPTPGNLTNPEIDSMSLTSPALAGRFFLSLAPPGKPSMQDFKHDLTSMRDACNCPMVSAFFSTSLLGN